VTYSISSFIFYRLVSLKLSEIKQLIWISTC